MDFVTKLSEYSVNVETGGTLLSDRWSIITNDWALCSMLLLFLMFSTMHNAEWVSSEPKLNVELFKYNLMKTVKH